VVCLSVCVFVCVLIKQAAVGGAVGLRPEGWGQGAESRDLRCAL